MEIKGDEFIKKVQLQQEREELEQKLSELEEVQTSIGENTTIRNESVNEPIDTELGNIMLDTPSSNEESNKKKYLILGLILVILFLLTIIVIRLLTDDSKEDTFTTNKTDPIETKTTTEDSNIEENFQKIMNERIQKNSQKEKEDSQEANSEEKIDAINAQNEPEKVEEQQASNDILDETIKKIEAEIKPKKQEVKKVAPKKEVVKKAPKKSVKELVKDISSSAPKGYFVQIGAFSKKPSNSYIAKIQNANLKYKIHQVDVKGKLFNKVLIGPYSSRASAADNIENIKKKLNLSSAYILKF
ncbi:SPOR domain-containing protein [Poseidonibacter ostreae]|uniref:SPOR domain-containing protein n=1 Tax=Poseidonibacter ostreae TaxID=2654171 RepID=A0A6L4WVN3_9BACT|nr:SPOR domain-containing protein [Poseidonibacter ostreae]KAB7885651.1 SPOR domain-containing protein [Poseidonibacter ostreae]KAB7887023.1 SPOR domain-containing protein [Poseidonibacter ostreae]KAB7889865.1 SPOR domain-containing protein [Poseidonibacter ostreae]